MALTSPTNIYYPDENTPFNINAILANMASSIEAQIGPYVENRDYESVPVFSAYNDTGSGRHLVVGRTGKLVTLSWFITKVSGNLAAGGEHVATLPEEFWPPINHWGNARGASSDPTLLSHFALNTAGEFRLGSVAGDYNASLGIITYRTQ